MKSGLQLRKNPRRKAITALATLMKPLAQFPFVTPADRAVRAAAILTSIQRRLLGPCPLICYGAPVQRSGKSLLASSNGIIATGFEPAASTVPQEEVELKKSITATLRAGDAIILLDNIEHVLRSPELCIAITQPFYQDRILGETTRRVGTTIARTAPRARAAWRSPSGRNVASHGSLRSLSAGRDTRVWTRAATPWRSSTPRRNGQVSGTSCDNDFPFAAMSFG